MLGGRVPIKMCLHVLLRENGGFGHPAGKISAQHFPFCYKSCGALCLFGTNQQTTTLKRLKATSTWNIRFAPCAQSQALQTVRKNDFRQALVETTAKSQALQTARKSDFLQALVETIAKSQALQTVRQTDVLQALVEIIAKSQALQTAR